MMENITKQKTQIVSALFFSLLEYPDDCSVFYGYQFCVEKMES